MSRSRSPGSSLAFVESLELGSEDRAAIGAVAVVLSPLGAALGNIALKRRGAKLDAIVLNGWGMLVGGALLLAGSAASEDWGDAVWGANAIGSILYLAVVGSAVAFVVLTILLREMSAQASSFIALMIPFGALIFGAVLYDEAITGRAVAGAALVVAGLLAARSGGSSARRRRVAERRERRRSRWRCERARRAARVPRGDLVVLPGAHPRRARARRASRSRPSRSCARASRTARRSASTCARRARTSCGCT